MGHDSTASDVIRVLGTSLAGKNVIVTGASSGIGAEAARVLAHAGANVWFAGRDVAKTQRVRDAVVAEVGAAASGRLHVLALELSSLASVKKAAAEFLALGVPLHILLNNAGCMALPERATTEDGFEMQVLGGGAVAAARAVVVRWCCSVGAPWPLISDGGRES